MALTVGFDATAAAQQSAGIGRYTRELLGALSEEPAEITYRLVVYARGPGAGRLPPLSARFRVRRIPVSDRIMNAIWHRARLPLPVQALSGRFDVFHSPDFTLPPTGRKPSVLTVHDLAFLRVPDCAYPTLRQYLQRAVPRSARRATRVIAVSETTRDDLVQLLRIPEDRIAVIPEAPGSEFRVCSDRDALLQLLQPFSIRLPYILAVGTIEPRKNYPRLLTAYALLRARGVRHQLVIAGRTGWMYEPTLQRLRELDLERHVSFVEPDDRQLAALYNLAEVFVYPSLYEGFGIPPLEALACGAPVACSQASSMPEVVGDAAVLFDPEDEEAMAAAIERLLRDDALRQELSRRGPKHASRFTWSSAAAATAQVYREAAADA